MDKATLKKLIIEMRKSDSSYGEIAHRLKTDYGVVMSRQAVYTMHKRAMGEDTEGDGSTVQITDILNYRALGVSKQKIQEVTGVSKIKLDEIIGKEEWVIDVIKEDMVGKAIMLINHGYSMDKIEQLFSFKGMGISKGVLAKIIKEASARIIKDTAVEKQRSISKVLGVRVKVDITVE